MMIRNYFLAVSVLSAGIASAALAEPAAKPTPAAASSNDAGPAAKTKMTPDPNKVVCKTEEVIGSRLDTKRECMTRAQWDDQAHDAGQSVSDAQRGH